MPGKCGQSDNYRRTKKSEVATPYQTLNLVRRQSGVLRPGIVEIRVQRSYAYVMQDQEYTPTPHHTRPGQAPRPPLRFRVGLTSKQHPVYRGRDQMSHISSLGRREKQYELPYTRETVQASYVSFFATGKTSLTHF